MTQISLDLPDEWLLILEAAAQVHVFGAKTKQDVIRAMLEPAITGIKEKVYPTKKEA
jgi:hypothetical protein